MVLPETENRHRAAVEIGTTLADLPISKDVLVTTPAEIARRGHVIGSVLREALREGEVIFERA